MPNGRDYHDRSPHMNRKREGIIKDPEGGPEMGIRIDTDPSEKKQNPNPYHLSDKSKKEIEGFSRFFDDEW